MDRTKVKRKIDIGNSTWRPLRHCCAMAIGVHLQQGLEGRLLAFLIHIAQCCVESVTRDLSMNERIGDGVQPNFGSRDQWH